MSESKKDPERYVENNSDELVYIIKRSNNQFIRGLCLAALIKYNQSEIPLDQIKNDLDQLQALGGLEKS